MSDCKWCDVGNHPFSTLSVGWQSMVVAENQYNAVTGQMGQQQVKRDVCAEHAIAPLSQAKEITASEE